MKKEFTTLVLAATTALLMACSSGVSFDLPATSDNFGQSVTYNNKVDILWIIDNSESMQKHQQKLSDQIPDLVSRLNSLKMDYHMAVVTTSMGGTLPDGGKFIGTPKYVTSATPDLVNNLKGRMLAGQAGSNNERGLESLVTALSPTYLSNEGRGFLRSDAMLVVIALSNEDDKSFASSVVPSTYTTTFLDNLKEPWVDGSRSWMFNFIGVLSINSTCTALNEYVEAGLNFVRLATETKGVQESICNGSLANAVTNIRSRIYEILTEFKLTGKPLVETIVVKINGVVVPRSAVNGWQYDATKNSIRFYGTAVPSADASIKVDFKPAEAS